MRHAMKHYAGQLWLAAALGAAFAAPAAQAGDSGQPAASVQAALPASGKIAPYQARFGRTRPVVAVVGENGSANSTTEVTDFVIPYAVLSQSGAAETIALATQPGPLKMRQALQLDPHATVAQFDGRYPDGADYVIVPAVTKFEDPTLLNWIRAQAAKGATIVSICDGAMVVASSGLMKGRRATAHWDTEELRFSKYADIAWQKNVRYVADGNIVSSSGISAALPTSIALVEAIAGGARAEALARELGVTDWGTQHNSDVFLPKFGVNLMAFATSHFTNGWFHATDSIGVPVAAGVDDMALAFTADAYSRTGRSQAYAVAATAAPVRTRHGLMVVPDRVAGSGRLDRTLPALDASQAGRALDKALADIAARYGRRTAFGVALDFEYPGFND